MSSDFTYLLGMDCNHPAEPGISHAVDVTHLVSPAIESAIRREGCRLILREHNAPSGIITIHQVGVAPVIIEQICRMGQWISEK